jgi:heptaprenyl diphosphate synthase
MHRGEKGCERMSEFKEKIANIKETIEKYVLHPYMQKYIIPPIIDEDRIMVLLSIVDDLDLSPFEKDTYVIAIMLMYTALDTHDQVSINNTDRMKSRQLTVLAGDYYSGLYYKFLAKLNDTHVIKLLSEGVKTVNEQKVTIYNNSENDLNMLMKRVKIIEFSLMEKITQHHGVTYWNESIVHFLLIKRLMKEKKHIESAEPSIVFHAINRFIHSNIQHNRENVMGRAFMRICDEYIQSSAQGMAEGLKQIPKIQPLLKDRMLEIIERQETMK